MKSHLEGLPGDGVASIFDRRILQRINLKEGMRRESSDAGLWRTACVVDVETTGLSSSDDAIIELALRRFQFDLDGVIVKIGHAQSWREDPGFPLSAEITDLTGLSDSDLAGQKINDVMAINILSSVDVIIAHNSAFDRPFVEARFPDLPAMDWGCSCVEIDWRASGFEGRSLGYLAMQAGWFFDPHRAQADVDAVIQMLCHENADGVPLLYELNQSVLSDSHLIEAVGAAFDVKDALRLRGYRWNANDKVWWREVFDRELFAEQAWLAREVYAQSKMPTRMGPRTCLRTALERYR